MASNDAQRELLKAHDATSAEIRATDIGVTIMAVVFVALRFASRWMKATGIGADDYLIAASLPLLFANLAINLVMVDNGLGLPAATLQVDQLITTARMIFIDEFIYLVNLALIKIAILVMYCRIFALRSFKIGAWTISIITVIWSMVFIFICVFQCSPISRAWNPTVPGTCVNLRGLFIGNAVPNIVTDALILVMPVRQVWKLQIRLIQRLTLTAIFFLGAFVIFASIYRLVTLLQLDQFNLSYTLRAPTTWSHIEICAAVVSACLPTLRPIVMQLMIILGLSKTDSQNESNTWKSGNSTEGGTGTRAASRPFKTLHDPEMWPPEVNEFSDKVPLRSIKVRTDVVQNTSLEDEDKHENGGEKGW